MNTSTAGRTVRLSAVYDLAVTAGFALPVTAPALLAGLSALHLAWALPGSVPDPTDPFTLMFANLMGSLVVVCSVYRLVRPSWAAGVAETAGRLLFALGMAAALAHGASPLVVGMLVLELLWAVAQAVVVLRARRALMVGVCV